MTKAFTQPLEPYVVTTDEAMRLGGWGRTRLYGLINSGELESFLDGRIRRITTASIREHIRKKLEQSGNAKMDKSLATAASLQKRAHQKAQPKAAPHDCRHSET
jgi:hypothetical protein